MRFSVPSKSDQILPGIPQAFKFLIQNNRKGIMVLDWPELLISKICTMAGTDNIQINSNRMCRYERET
uniref:Uncharacterized protein n=1 Tax=Rhizophora mucronata TaxID=61149 RepID=A0A2P2IHF6_RHIMU